MFNQTDPGALTHIANSVLRVMNTANGVVGFSSQKHSLPSSIHRRKLPRPEESNDDDDDDDGVGGDICGDGGDGETHQSIEACPRRPLPVTA